MSYLTINEMSIILKIPARTIQYLIQKGEGPDVIRIGRTIRVTEESFAKWIEILNTEEEDSRWNL